MKHLKLPALLALALVHTPAVAQEPPLELTPDWEFVADTVMGGVSTGNVTTQMVDGQQTARLTGTVSLDNNGGFVQMAFDLAPRDGIFDASQYTGIEMVVRGNNEPYDLRLRTDELRRPWHSFRTKFMATSEWQTLRIPFAEFEQHRTEVTFDPARLRRVGILAIGRVFEADVTVARVSLY